MMSGAKPKIDDEKVKILMKYEFELDLNPAEKFRICRELCAKLDKVSAWNYATNWRGGICHLTE